MNYPSPGIYENVPFDLYRADDITTADNARSVIGKAVSKSLIVSFMPDPAAWKASPKKQATSAMTKGSLFDCLLTEPETLNDRFVVSEYAEFRSNESKAWKASVEAEGITVIKQADMEAAQAQLSAVQSNPDAMKLINGSQKQVAFRHRTKYGFDAKGLIDIVPTANDTLVDIKTCQSSALESHRSLARHCFEFSYHLQAGAYCEGFSLASGSERIKFKFIFVTSTPPFRVAVVELPFCAILLGADQYRAGMAKFAECLKNDNWPSIWDGVTELDIPQYAYQEAG